MILAEHFHPSRRLVVLAEEHVAIDFVDEDVVPDAWVRAVRPGLHDWSLDKEFEKIKIAECKTH